VCCEGNPEGGLLYAGLREICNGSLWKRKFSFIELHKENLRHLAKGVGAWPICSLDRNPYLIYCCVMYNLMVCGLIFDHYTLRSISSVGSGKLKPEVNLSKINPGFFEAIERKGRK
jgi:hypothetical protein